MNVRIKLFGGLQDRYPGYNRAEGFVVDIPDSTTAGRLLNHLGIRKSAGGIVIAEGKVLKKSDELKNDSEIQIMQPIYGG